MTISIKIDIHGPMIETNIGKMIIKARIDKGFRQSQLALISGISKDHLSRIENVRQHNICLTTIFRIFEPLGLDLYILDPTTNVHLRVAGDGRSRPAKNPKKGGDDRWRAENV